MYKGYRVIKGTTEYINEQLAETSDLVVNEYVIIENEDDGSIKEMRYDGERFVNLNLPPSKFIKGKNSLQRCALDMLNNPDIIVCALYGPAGSGKSFLAMQMGLYALREAGTQSKIVGIREPVGSGRSVGFLGGTYEQKTENFFMPLAQKLNNGRFELEEMQASGQLENWIPYYCKGMSFQDSIIIVEEAEDLTEQQIKLIGSRIDTGSRMFFDGDYKQAIKNSDHSNPYMRMADELMGNKHFACIYLDENVRSEGSKMFDNIFEN